MKAIYKILSISGFFLSQNACSATETSTTKIHDSSHTKVTTVISQNPKKQTLSPCPTFEIESVNCNRQEKIDIQLQINSTVEKISAPEPDKSQQKN